MAESEQRREYYRLDYPAPERPSFVMKERHLEVSDLSERGLALVVTPETPVYPLGAELEGTIEFKHSAHLAVIGRVVRHQPGLICLQLVGQVVPWSNVLAEQRAILKRYSVVG